jgi:hypothetical protein
VTPWSKKHPDGGSATAQRTDSVTGNAIPSAQVAHSTPQSDLSDRTIDSKLTTLRPWIDCSIRPRTQRGEFKVRRCPQNFIKSLAIVIGPEKCFFASPM